MRHSLRMHITAHCLHVSLHAFRRETAAKLNHGILRRLGKTVEASDCDFDYRGSRNSSHSCYDAPIRHQYLQSIPADYLQFQ